MCCHQCINLIIANYSLKKCRLHISELFHLNQANQVEMVHNLKLDWCFKTKEREVTQPSHLCGNNPNAKNHFP